METNEVLLILCAALCCVLVALAIAVLVRLRSQGEEQTARQREDYSRLNQDVSAANRLLGEMIGQNQLSMAQSLSAQLMQMEGRIQSLEKGNEQKLENMRTTIEQRLARIQADNNQRLEEMRKTVDETLQKNLETKLNESFRLVSERLELVYRSLGEMQSLAVGVGDLKKVLSNVKTRGILGEIQLGAILTEILSPEQYETNAQINPQRNTRVEYAVKFPSEDERAVYLPIDSKFPADMYMHLQEAYESGSAETVQVAAGELCAALRKSAKEIRDKYIDPPYSTDFAILFLPTEGLYAEAVNRGMVEVLQRECKVNIAGPSTMAALLNSLQMGFRTLAIQKRSSEVWELLGAVKNDFEKYQAVLEKTQTRLRQADQELQTLVGTRTNAILRRLKAVQSLEDGPARQVLEQEAYPVAEREAYPAIDVPAEEDL